jgi:hypothetical protein
MLRCLEVEFLSLSVSCGAVSSKCSAEFSNMCSTRADNSSRKLRLRCGCQFPWYALVLSVPYSNWEYSCAVTPGDPCLAGPGVEWRCWHRGGWVTLGPNIERAEKSCGGLRHDSPGNEEEPCVKGQWGRVGSSSWGCTRIEWGTTANWDLMFKEVWTWAGFWCWECLGSSGAPRLIGT